MPKVWQLRGIFTFVNPVADFAHSVTEPLGRAVGVSHVLQRSAHCMVGRQKRLFLALSDR